MKIMKLVVKSLTVSLIITTLVSSSYNYYTEKKAVESYQNKYNTEEESQRAENIFDFVHQKYNSFLVKYYNDEIINEYDLTDNGIYEIKYNLKTDKETLRKLVKLNNTLRLESKKYYSSKIYDNMSTTTLYEDGTVRAWETNIEIGKREE